jgi:hypothetical protein
MMVLPYSARRALQRPLSLSILRHCRHHHLLRAETRLARVSDRTWEMMVSR